MGRFILKMSGEAIADADGESFLDVERLDVFAAQVATATASDDTLQVGVVVGGGNILRGRTLAGVSRTKADHMGMLATVINSLALQDALYRCQVESRVMTGLDIPRVAEPFILGRAIKHLARGRVVIFGGGTGNPHFTTDTAAALRGSEVGADALLFAKYGTDGVWDKDPNTNADATHFPSMAYEDLLTNDLEVMDHTAVTLCRDSALPIFVFDMNLDRRVEHALLGRRDFGTLIGPK